MFSFKIISVILKENTILNKYKMDEKISTGKEKHWSESIETTLKDIEKSCENFKLLNIFAARKNERKYNFLMYCSIVLGPLTGVISASLNTDSEYNSQLSVIVTVFSFLTGMCSAINKFSEFGDKALVYKNIASKYASLEINIKRQLSLEKVDRINSSEFLEWVSNSYDELFNTTPLVSDSIYEEWVEKNKQEKVLSENVKQKDIENPNNIEKKFADEAKLKYELFRLHRMK